MKSYIIKITFYYSGGGFTSSEICVTEKCRKTAVSEAINKFYDSITSLNGEIPDGYLSIDYSYELKIQQKWRYNSSERERELSGQPLVKPLEMENEK